MVERVLNVSAALVVYDHRGGIWLGSATCIRVGQRFLLATAGHNLRHLSHLRTIPRGRYQSDPIRSLGLGTGRARDDVGWVELCPRDVERRGVAFLELEHLDRGISGSVRGHKPVRGHKRSSEPRPESYPDLLTHGFPASGIDPKCLNSTDFEFHGALISGLASVPGRRGEIVQAWRHCDLPPQFQPTGLSGGGMWRRDGNGDYRLAGLAQTWHGASGFLHGTAIDRWLSTVTREFPELRSIVEAG